MWSKACRIREILTFEEKEGIWVNFVFVGFCLRANPRPHSTRQFSFKQKLTLLLDWRGRWWISGMTKQLHSEESNSGNEGSIQGKTPNLLRNVKHNISQPLNYSLIKELITGSWGESTPESIKNWAEISASTQRKGDNVCN